MRRRRRRRSEKRCHRHRRGSGATNGRWGPGPSPSRPWSSATGAVARFSSRSGSSCRTARARGARLKTGGGGKTATGTGCGGGGEVGGGGTERSDQRKWRNTARTLDPTTAASAMRCVTHSSHSLFFRCRITANHPPPRTRSPQARRSLRAARFPARSQHHGQIRALVVQRKAPNKQHITSRSPPSSPPRTSTLGSLPICLCPPSCPVPCCSRGAPR